MPIAARPATTATGASTSTAWTNTSSRRTCGSPTSRAECATSTASGSCSTSSATTARRRSRCRSTSRSSGRSTTATAGSMADHQNLPPEQLDPANPLHRFFHRERDLAELSDFDDANPAVMDYLVGAYLQWIEQGASAFRIDTIRHVSPAFWHEFTRADPRAPPGLLHVRGALRVRRAKDRHAHAPGERRRERARLSRAGRHGRSVRETGQRLRANARGPAPRGRRLPQSLRADVVLRQPRHGAPRRHRGRFHRREQLAVHVARHSRRVLRLGDRVHGGDQGTRGQSQLSRPQERRTRAQPSRPRGTGADCQDPPRFTGAAARPAGHPRAEGRPRGFPAGLRARRGGETALVLLNKGSSAAQFEVDGAMACRRLARRDEREHGHGRARRTPGARGSRTWRKGADCGTSAWKTPACAASSTGR